MAITASDTRRSLAGLIERVNLDRVEIEIVSRRGSAVLMTKDEYDSLTETGYLLSSPTNAERWLSAFTAAREGGATTTQLYRRIVFHGVSSSGSIAVWMPCNEQVKAT
ncbi:type II toxin-antitoxin system Phd/YefM family antitoxin [Cryobacterium arcticum]|uniref:Antitoxin n=1 Tax=Cryobacterium arcticum TaxID=670052 RepID=A0A1B1BKA4_9MICO|nr:type II toxin-antitoxin system prevent-host-death family antitoxin [Cryobacterium arcticum]ANP73042.1 antitoxin [Cryobacterium arcticum]